MDSEKKLYILFGVPGSGKTSRARDNNEINGGVRYEADDYQGLYIDGRIQFRLLRNAHEWCQLQIKSAMKNSISKIYQSNTNLNPIDMIKYLKYAHQFGYCVKIIFPEKGNILFYDTELSYDEQIDVVIKNRNGEITCEKIIQTEKMIQMIKLFETNIIIMRKIKNKLDKIDRENDPVSWIHEINDNFTHLKK